MTSRGPIARFIPIRFGSGAESGCRNVSGTLTSTTSLSSPLLLVACPSSPVPGVAIRERSCYILNKGRGTSNQKLEIALMEVGQLDLRHAEVHRQVVEHAVRDLVGIGVRLLAVLHINVVHNGFMNAV